MRTTIWTLILSLALVSAAGAAPTAEEKCRAAKLNALSKRTFCIKGERRKEVLGMTPDTAKCEEKFVTAIAKADEKAAAQSTPCRWLDNADGTATDLNDGLQWELKTDDGSVHDKDNTYTWATDPYDVGTTPNGPAFTAFLGTLNGGVSGDGSTTTGCFAGHCDWRLPTIGELLGILDCTMSPCTTIPGFTQVVASNPLSEFYWSSSTASPRPDFVWFVNFYYGLSFFGSKSLGGSDTFGGYVRAVRGGS